jgi:HEPN domain-containing protein
MNAKLLPPDDPKEWLNRAYSNLSQAKGGINLSNVYLEDLCFQAQQAVEKALKAVLIANDIRFPYTHDLAALLSLIVQADISFPRDILRAAQLSDYAVTARYPSVAEPITQKEYEQSIIIAEKVLNWAETAIDEALADGNLQDNNNS